MIHKLTLGHFDIEALKDRKLVVMRPLDMSVVTSLLKELGQVSDDGRPSQGRRTKPGRKGHIRGNFRKGP
jgi:hypothetical protein